MASFSWAFIVHLDKPPVVGAPVYVRYELPASYYNGKRVPTVVDTSDVCLGVLCSPPESVLGTLYRLRIIVQGLFRSDGVADPHVYAGPGFGNRCLYTPQ